MFAQPVVLKAFTTRAAGAHPAEHHHLRVGGRLARRRDARAVARGRRGVFRLRRLRLAYAVHDGVAALGPAPAQGLSDMARPDDRDPHTRLLQESCPARGLRARAQFHTDGGGAVEIPANFGCRMWHRRCSSAPATVRDGAMGSHQEVPMDQQKVEALAFRMVADMAASFSMALGHIGDRLGLFRAMKGAGPLTREQLALKTGLKAGIEVADVGCGYGLSTMTMAAAFPASRFLGIDYHAGSIFRARRASAERRLLNVEWRAEPANQLPRDRRFGLMCAFDCIHDMVDPKGTLRAIRTGLADDGVFLWSEPNASDNPLENRHPVGKAFQCVSPLHCMTVSLAHRGEGLGTVIGERGVRALAREAGFSHVEKLPVQNPFNQFFVLRT